MLLLLQEYQPDEMAIEELFYNRNSTTVISVGQARGVLILAAAQRGVPIYEYTPLQIKQAVTGYGKAEKKQVQYMVKSTLGLNSVPKPDDAADALAVAVCHSNWQQANHWQKDINTNLV
jgi:crossover junction endodeoxyribonuclease RuvC